MQVLQPLQFMPQPHVLLQAVEPLGTNLCMVAAETQYMRPPATPATGTVALERMYEQRG